MVVGLLGNESSDLNRLTLVTPKSENDVRLQATLDNQNPTGLPVGVVSLINKINGQNTHLKYTKYLKDNMGEDQ
ncbi:hypothetical protein DW698_14080 [Lachnospiraceae bacterium AM26-1LB]|nr:hypothetical protein DW698_14080 [Lachnospiraceae bacterium AM26-1LB]